MRLIILAFILSPLIVSAQQQEVYIPLQVYAEVDTIQEIAYKEYDCGWQQQGFAWTSKICKDSIGIDTVQVISYFFYTEEGQKIYSNLAERHYLSGPKGYRSFEFKTYNLPDTLTVPNEIVTDTIFIKN